MPEKGSQFTSVNAQKPSFDLGPILARTGTTAGEFSQTLGRSRRVGYKWQEDGLSANKADELAIAAGTHPTEIFGHDWLEKRLPPLEPADPPLRNIGKQSDPKVFSLDHILSKVEYVSDYHLSDLLGVSRNSIQKWRKEGINQHQAHELSSYLLGQHPKEVYGEEHWETGLQEASRLTKEREDRLHTSKLEYQKKYNTKQRENLPRVEFRKTPSERTFDLTPLMQHGNFSSGSKMAEALGVPVKTLNNWRKTGVDPRLAHNISKKLFNKHPKEIYGDAWPED